MNYKKTIRIEDRGPITLWLGDSQVWMKTAVEKDWRSGRGRKDVETDHHELNVAHVCAGLAFELALRALAKSEGRPTTKKHEKERRDGQLREAKRFNMRREEMSGGDLT